MSTQADIHEERDASGKTANEYFNANFANDLCSKCGREDDYHVVSKCSVTGYWLMFCVKTLGECPCCTGFETN